MAKGQSIQKESVPPERLFPIGIRLGGILETLRGHAFRFEDNLFGFDQVVDFPGLGGELEISYQGLSLFRAYASVGISLFGKTTDYVSQQLPPTPPSTEPVTVRYPIYFQGWTLLHFALGLKLYPFPEDWLRFYMKGGFGFTVQSQLKSIYQGREILHLKERAGFALELGCGVEVLYRFPSFELGLFFEAKFPRFFKQKGPLIRLVNNTYSFPLQFGCIVYF